MNASLTIGSRVEFDSEHGPQRGTVQHINRENGALPDHAIVNVDHTLEGIYWTVELDKLTLLPATKRVAA